MKKYIFLVLLSAIISISSFAQCVGLKEAQSAAQNKILILNNNHKYSIDNKIIVSNEINNLTLYYVFNLSPHGYVIVTSRKELPQVIAYSFTNNYIDNVSAPSPLKDLLKNDINIRIALIPEMNENEIIRNRRNWDNLLTGNRSIDKHFQQWPEDGTTTTGGWIESNWTQSSPYDNFCPIDPLTSQRSYVGCPATAMGQIVNYYQQINSTKFDDNDDYYHSYAGRNYWIDDDYKDHGFLCFQEINDYLDSISTKYDDGRPLTYDEKAALSFACGVAAHQVYSSAGSGTFGIDQAYDAYMKFGFPESELIYDGDTNLFNVMSQNMMDARPVHFAVVNEQGNSGHNVVVDGYNTDDYYHVNFGWGGSYNGWYLLPQDFPLGLTVIEGVVVNIAYPPINTGFNNNTSVINNDITIYPNPARDYLNINLGESVSGKVNIRIMGINGKLIYREEFSDNILVNELQIELGSICAKGLVSGIYILKIDSDSYLSTTKFVVK